ncbi:hypothetical protein L7F22_059801 [Adiantum nelumboides]|nr:hypothetical protein [Adiantum nelumboides]
MRVLLLLLQYYYLRPQSATCTSCPTLVVPISFTPNGAMRASTAMAMLRVALAYDEEEETGTAYLQVRRHGVPACLDAGKEGNILASIDPAARRTDHAHWGKPVEGVAGGDQYASSNFCSAWRASCGVAACAPSWGA